MALAAAMAFEVRTTGADDQGGAFKTGASGTDRSQQDAAQTTFTDLVIGSAGNEDELTSAGNPFGASDVGNVLNVTSGTGFTTGRYEVLSVAGSTATMDRNVGTAGSTGGNGKLGGAIKSPSLAARDAVAGNTIHVKSGTYSCSSTADVADGRVLFDVNAAAASPIRMVGYGSTREDGGTKPVLQATNSTMTVINCTGASLIVENIQTGRSASETAVTGFATATLSGHLFWSCKAHDVATGFNGTSALDRFIDCEASQCSSNGFSAGTAAAGAPQFQGCVAHDGSGSANGFSLGGTGATLIDCIADSNGGDGFTLGIQDVLFVNCTAYGNGGNGFENNGNGGTSTFINCLSVSNTGHGFKDSATVSRSNKLLNCAVYNNTAGTHDFTAESVDGLITLTADPFVSAAAGNFALNSTAGGGADVRNDGLPSAYPGTSTTSYPAVGAQQPDVAATTTGSKKHFAGRRIFS